MVMPKKKKATGTPWVDPDDAAELTADWFERADFYIGDKLIKRVHKGETLRPIDETTAEEEAETEEPVETVGEEE